MIDARLLRTRKNIIVSLGYQLVTIFCGLIVPRVMLKSFGSEIYGATTSIAQFLSYIALLEGGVGGVARSVLYKPLADKDNGTLSHIMAETKSFFRVVGFVFTGYVLVVACVFKQISGLICLDWITSFLLVFAISLSTFGQYFIGISNAILIQAAQRSYVTNFINIFATIVNAISVCILVRAECSIVTVKLVSSLIFLLRPIVFWLYVRRRFQMRSVYKSNVVYLTQKWSGLGQHIAFYLHSNTDIVILTCFTSLYNVAVYAVYNMIVSHVQNLVSSFASGMEALFGDMLAREEQETLHKSFNNYEMILSLVSVIFFATTLSMVLPFVKLYTAEITDVNYHMPLLALFLTVSSLLYCLRLPYHSLVIAAGHFRQTQLAAYAEALVNILLSIIFVFFYGVAGVAFATMFATALRFGYYVLYLSKHILFRKPTLFVRSFIVNCLAFTLSITVGLTISNTIDINNYMRWALYAGLNFLVITTITVIINIVFYHKELLDMIKNTRINKGLTLHTTQK